MTLIMILKVSTSLSCSGRADCLNFSLPLYRVCEEPRGYCQPKGGTSLKLQRLAKSRRKSRRYVNHQPHSKELFSSPTERIQDLRQRLQEEETASKNVKHLPPVLWPLASQIAQHKFAKPYVILYVRVIRTNSISYVVYHIFTGGQKPLYMIVSSHILHSGSHVRITVAVQPLLVECLNVV